MPQAEAIRAFLPFRGVNYTHEALNEEEIHSLAAVLRQ